MFKNLNMIEAPKLLKINSFFAGTDVIGFQFFIWLFVDSIEKWKNRPISRQHELIHFQQGRELLFIFFWFFYVLNYLVNLLIYWNGHEAYINICFEREAYAMQKESGYLAKRRKFAFLQWLI